MRCHAFRGYILDLYITDLSQNILRFRFRHDANLSEMLYQIIVLDGQKGLLPKTLKFVTITDSRLATVAKSLRFLTDAQCNDRAYPVSTINIHVV